ncbi:hypothetical protein ES707_14858 [subsurface metagenome]
MREEIIHVSSLLSVEVIDGIIEICTVDKHEGTMLMKIDGEAWDEICVKVVAEMERGATPEEEVE